MFFVPAEEIMVAFLSDEVSVRWGVSVVLDECSSSSFSSVVNVIISSVLVGKVSCSGSHEITLLTCTG